MPLGGFEHTIPALERMQTHALDWDQLYGDTAERN
jgi:hypothetical protein